MAESSSSCHMQPNSYSTWMIATAVSSSYGISGPTCNHLLANLAPSWTLMHPQHPPRHFGLQVGLSIQVGSLNIDLGRCGKNLGWQFVPCHEQHRPGMVNFGAHGMPWNAMECHGMPWNVGHHVRWSNKDLSAKARFALLSFLSFQASRSSRSSISM